MAQKRAVKADRRQQAQQLREQARQAERRRNLLAYGGAALVAAVILALAVVPPLVARANAPERQPWTHFGTSAAVAGCTDVTVPADQLKAQQHVTSPVRYSLLPPAGGPHFADDNSPDTSAPRFLPPSYRTTVESYVHNLEHGYLVIWYAPGLSKHDVSTLKGLAAKAAKVRPGAKVKVVPWPADRGPFPAGKAVALTTWGHEQTCAAVSGPAVQAFSAANPPTSAPEPFGV